MQNVSSAKPNGGVSEVETLPTSSDSEELRAYTKTKLALATQLRALLDVLKKRGSESRFRRCEELMVKLAEDRFTLAVVGQFKRGKSSLMNAIIGRDLLPTGVLPLTSAITVLRFGAAERVVVYRDGLQFPEIVPVAALANYVTERGNPGNRRKVKTAAVEVPLPFLRRGLEFVDTPGVGSAIEANSATTYKFLPECDAVIFVTSVDTPFTEAELDFLNAIREHVHKIFFVVNKTDLLPDQRERDDVLKFIESELRAEMNAAEIRLFPVSSLLAMTTSDLSEANGSVQSGFKEFQATLADFLAQEKATVFLTAIIDKALRLVDEELKAIELHQSARGMPQTAVLERLNLLRDKWRELEAARQPIFGRLRDDLERSAIESNAPRLDEMLRIDEESLSRHIGQFIAADKWRLGEEVVSRWTAFVSKRLAKTTESWMADVARNLDLGSQPVAIETVKQLEANLRKIPQLAATVFDLPLAQSETELPPLRAQTFAYPARAPNGFENNLEMFLRFLPVRMTTRWFESCLKELTGQLVKIHRAHALALIAAGVKNITTKWASEVDALASENESRVRSTITGERPTSGAWRQTSSPIAAPGWGGTELAAIHARLVEIRDANHGDAVSLEKQTAAGKSTASSLPEAFQPSQTAPKRRRTVDLAFDLQTRGCAVCDHVIKTAHDFFAQWQYALASDEKAQQRFAADLGFCPLHAWQLHSLSSPLGESIGLARLAEETSRLLGDMKQEQAIETVLKMLHTSESCRACRLLRQDESEYIGRLSTFLADENNRKLYERSQGVCLRHLGDLIAVTPEEFRAFLLGQASRRFGEIAEDMQNYAIKRDAIRQHLTNADEEDAYLRALIHLAGAKDYSAPWPEDREI